MNTAPHTCISFNQFWKVLKHLGFFFASFGAVSAATAPHLAVTHWEFSENFTFRGDDLSWEGVAASWRVFQDTGSGFNEIGRVNGSGTGGSLDVALFAKRGTRMSYFVMGFDAQGRFVGQSGHAIEQQLLPDPGFLAGPNSPEWTQFFDDATGSFFTNYIEGVSGNFSARVGGFTSETDSLSTDIVIPILTEVVNPHLDLKFVLTVSSQEDPGDNNVYDQLMVEFSDVNTGEILSSMVVADNRDGSDGFKDFKNITINYDQLKGRTVQLLFRSTNDEILSTFFEITHVQLNLQAE